MTPLDVDSATESAFSGVVYLEAFHRTAMATRNASDVKIEYTIFEKLNFATTQVIIDRAANEAAIYEQSPCGLA